MGVLFVLGCSSAIEHGLDESSANEVVTALERAGVPAGKTRDESKGDSFVVSVAKADVVRSFEILHSLELPRPERAGFGEIYRQGSLLPTPTEERARYVAALTGEIAKTLEAVEGVARARIHLVLPEPDPVDGRPRVAAQAAVLLKTRAGQGPPISETEVRKLVAGSVPGLDSRAVAVVFTAAAGVQGSPAGLVALGPLRMTYDTRVTVVIVGAVAAGLLVLLAILVLLMARRLGTAYGSHGEEGAGRRP
jgi:type III secretion protein J